MSVEPVILAVDLGTSSMKTALITISGKVLGWESAPISMVITPDGGTEQSPDEWWHAFLSTSQVLLQKFEDRKCIRAICCSTQGEGTIPVNKEGDPLMNCILWMDMRGAASLRKHFKGFINVMGMGISNTLRWIRLTGGMPSLTGKDPAAHMLFIRDNFPEIYNQTYKFLNVLDYLNLKLTGRIVATVDSILTSWVTDNRNPQNVHYDDGLVKASGINPNKFPEIVACTNVIGSIKPDVAVQLGLSKDVQVVAGAIDTTAAAIGSGAVEDDALHLYVGTSSWMAAHVKHKKTDIITSLASVPCAIPDRYLLIALQATAGGNLTFLRDNVIYHKDELLQEADVPDIFKVLDKIAGRTPAGSNMLIYTPWIWGERAPVEDRSLRAGLFNLSLHNTREDIIRAFLEGVALNTRWLLQPVEKFLNKKVPSINIIGGGAQSDVWCQIFADIMKREIRQLEDSIYANARGATWIGFVGLGEINFHDIPDLIKYKRIYEPNLQNSNLYDEHFEIFTQIYKKMHKLYKKINTK
jgi:xylulokinase